MPAPGLKTRKELARAAEDDLLVVECTDPLAEIDIPHLVNETGHALESMLRDGELIVFRIRRR
jgi:tRNA 2-thiouridine synthesizing protein A